MLTHTAAQNAKPKGKAYKLSDGGGLHVLVETTGSKLWRFRYEFDRKEKMLSFGSFPEVSLVQARAKRDDARRRSRSGPLLKSLRRRSFCCSSGSRPAAGRI